MTSTHDAALKPHMLCQSFCKSRFSRTNIRWELYYNFWVKWPVQYIMYFSGRNNPQWLAAINVLSEKILGVGISSKNQRLVVYWIDYSNKVIRILKSHARCTKLMWVTVWRYRSRTLNNVVSTQNHVQLWVRRTLMYHFQVLSNIVINRYLIFKSRIAKYAEQCS